jgi:hypothetical protein
MQALILHNNLSHGLKHYTYNRGMDDKGALYRQNKPCSKVYKPSAFNEAVH